MRPTVDVFAQIGRTRYRPKHLHWVASMNPQAYRRKFSAAEAIVAHAGTGTIITALEIGKPILVMPRRAALAETRNDHQVATARRFAALGRVMAAMDERELSGMLEHITDLQTGAPVPSTAPSQLLDAIADFVHGGQRSASTDY